jgi:two-component system, NtrC family, nitrogen regulation sensor histidine kinase GlnL
MIKAAPQTRTQKQNSDHDLMALVEAFQSFNRSTTQLNQAYHRLESASEELARELEDKNQQLQRKNQELDQARRYQEDILASIGSGVIAADLEGRVTIFNRTAAELTGYTPAEVAGQNYGDLFAGELGQESPLMRTLITGAPVEGFERELPLKKGGSVTVKSSSSWVTSSAGERIGVVETIEDLSRLRELEGQIQRRHTLEAMGEMAAQVAHELRNPLAGIKGFAGLLAEDLPPDSSGRRMVGRIIEGVDSLDRIASNLLILTQGAHGEMERQPLEPVFDQAIALVEASSRGRFSVTREFPAESTPVRVDAEKLKQLLLNLLKNASEAGEGQGQAETGYRCNLLTNEVRLYVRDHGPGVPPEMRDKIFRPFFTTHTQGTGLGLAIVKKIAEMHRGKVEYASPGGGGAMFTVTLPII